MSVMNSVRVVCRVELMEDNNFERSSQTENRAVMFHELLLCLLKCA